MKKLASLKGSLPESPTLNADIPLVVIFLKCFYDFPFGNCFLLT